MRRIIHAMDTTRFWMIVFVLSVLFVFAYAFVANRAAVARNSDVIRQMEDQLVHLCETIRVVDAVIVQRSVTTANALGSGDLPDWARTYLLADSRIFDTAHDDLSSARACRQIE